MRPPPITGNVEIDAWLKELWEFVNANKVNYVSQNAQPTLAKNSIKLWKDADGGPKYYIVIDLDGTAKKVEVT